MSVALKTGRNAPRRARAHRAKLTEEARTTLAPELSEWVDERARVTGASRSEVLRRCVEACAFGEAHGGLALPEAGRHLELVVSAQRWLQTTTADMGRVSEAFELLVRMADALPTPPPKAPAGAR